MIKQAIAQVDVPYLNKLFDTYLILKDEKELLKVGMKLIQKADKVNNSKRLIEIMDVVHDIVAKHRRVYRNIMNTQVRQEKKGEKKAKYLKEYTDFLASNINDMCKKIIKELKRGIQNTIAHSREMELFLQLNLADYCRYLCEISLNQASLEESIVDTEAAYQKFFSLAEDSNLHNVSPTNLTGMYHYAIFQYEILEKKNFAIDYLKEKHEIIVENLDVSYKLYVQSFYLMDLIQNTLTQWIVQQNLEKEILQKSQIQSINLEIV